MHPDGVAVTLDECEELAREEHFSDKWDAAANYASKMLPAIFRTDDPLMQVPFATNDRIKLESILNALETSVFTGDDAFGWVYQFWQSEEKKRINELGCKIDGEKLPAVTQLFTEPYMVNFLIDNTLGAWWVGRNPGITPPVKFEYLRLLEDGTPAAGVFEGWPDKTAEVTSLDPCMGSGHFISSLFTVFANLRMYEEGLSKEEATDLVISENLHGLELDARCTQIAAFNLALTAWKFCGHYKTLPEMDLACSGIAPKGKVEDWLKLVENANDERLVNGMRMLYDHFQLAPELGSLLDPSTIKADAFTAGFNELQPYLATALAYEVDKDQIERGIMAAGIAKAGEILAQKYTLLITNIPYLGGNKMSDTLYIHAEINYKNSKSDLATIFIDNSFKHLIPGGSFSFVTPQNWMQIKNYEKFREYLITYTSFDLICNLGKKAFRTAMYDFNVCLLVMSNKAIKGRNISALDIGLSNLHDEKCNLLKSVDISFVNQDNFINNPSKRILFSEHEDVDLVNNYFDVAKGSVSGDKHHYIHSFWEQCDFSNFKYWLDTPNEGILYSGIESIILWNNKQLKSEIGYALRGEKVFNRKGIAISKVNRNSFTIYDGCLFDDNIAVISPKDNNIGSIYEFIKSGEFNILISKLDSKLGITAGTFGQVSFDKIKWEKISDNNNGLPKPYSDDPTQWLFHGHPIKADNPLQVAVARLLGYRWPAENDSDMELSDEARALISAVKTFDALSDNDGIFCIPSVNGEEAGADRLRGFLQAVYGEQWGNSSLSSLFTKEGASASNLEDWLRKEFFTQHCKLFQNRPFIWHIWDGRPDGFSVLVNYHKLDKDNLSKLIYTYLGDWIRMCEAKKNSGESGAEGLLSAALKLKEKLELILEGEAPYDIFVRWKPLNQQPLGWDPDLNDGVRLNVRPFVEAGVLRSKFNIKWGIDRGKNPAGSYWGEIRDNDKHLRLEEKREAREIN